MKNEGNWTRQQINELVQWVLEQTLNDLRHERCSARIHRTIFPEANICGKSAKQCRGLIKELTDSRICKYRSLPEVMKAIQNENLNMRWIVGKVERNWSDEQKNKLFEWVFDQTRNDERHFNCNTRIYLLNFSEANIPNKSPKACLAFVTEIINARVPKQRNLSEVLTAYMERCKKAKIQKMKAQRPPRWNQGKANANTHTHKYERDEPSNVVQDEPLDI